MIEGISHFPCHLAHLEIFRILFVQRFLVGTLILDFSHPSLVRNGQFSVIIHFPLVIEPICKVILAWSPVNEITHRCITLELLASLRFLFAHRHGMEFIVSTSCMLKVYVLGKSIRFVCVKEILFRIQYFII